MFPAVAQKDIQKFPILWPGQPCFRHVRQFAYPARFLRQEPISRSLSVFRLQFPLILLHLNSYLKIPLIYKGLRPTTSLRSENASGKRQHPNLSSSKPNASESFPQHTTPGGQEKKSIGQPGSSCSAWPSQLWTHLLPWWCIRAGTSSWHSTASSLPGCKPGFIATAQVQHHCSFGCRSPSTSPAHTNDLSQAATVPESQCRSLRSRSGVLCAGANPPFVPCEHRGERASHHTAPYSLNSTCVNASAGQTRGLWCTKPLAGRKIILLAMWMDSIKLHDMPLVF